MTFYLEEWCKYFQKVMGKKKFVSWRPLTKRAGYGPGSESDRQRCGSGSVPICHGYVNMSLVYTAFCQSRYGSTIWLIRKLKFVYSGSMSKSPTAPIICVYEQSYERKGRLFLCLDHWLGQKIAPPGGLEPPTFRLTAERASQLRHGGCTKLQTESLF